MGKSETIRKNTKSKSSLGRALFKSRFGKATIQETGKSEKWLHTASLDDGTDWNRLNLKSVTEQNSLDEFLNNAELAATDFEAERLNVQFVTTKSMGSQVGVLSKEEEKRVRAAQEKHKMFLRIPRRPFWKTHDYDSETLQLKERESFLEWRRNLAVVQDKEHITMTPFEKNLEFWRQLWRVIERSDVIVQIVDARNPLLFYCSDLEAYVREVDETKVSLVLVNKSDFLTERQRVAWLRHFEARGIRAVFWSAALATIENGMTLEEDEESSGEDEENDKSTIDEEEDDEEVDAATNKFNMLADEKSEGEEEQEDEVVANDEETRKSTDEEESEEENSDDETEEDGEKSTDVLQKPSVQNERSETTHNEINNNEYLENQQVELESVQISDEDKEKCKVYNRQELIDFLKRVHTSPDKCKPGCTTIGLVGFPNVGKSSTINAVMQQKKVAVSETPGKTKHYQTLFVDDELLLCDCPGLVFPSFVSTRGELIINGILPIDQMRDYVEPINLVAHHIPRRHIEMVYGILLPKPGDGQDANRLPYAEEVCSSYSIYRGYMNHKGMPDVNRGARYILKDYVNGKLLYCYPPPEFLDDAFKFQDHHYALLKEMKYLEKMNKLEIKNKEPKMTRFDEQFFKAMQPRCLTKGGIVAYPNRHIRPTELGADVNAVSEASTLAELKRESKKHYKAHAKSKLRRKTSHFDHYDF